MFEKIVIPQTLLPEDGRFGAGPSLIRKEQLAVLGEAEVWGTSHRKPPVINLVKSVQSGLTELFSLPAGYEITLGNGGASAFWAISAVSLVRERARLAVFGEFGAKFANDLAAAPWLTTSVTNAPAGELARVDTFVEDFPADVYAYPQNETSTGVMSNIYRAPETGALTVVDAVSIAGAVEVDLSLVDAYYFSPQKCFGSDGGLWLAVLSPAAQERSAKLVADKGRPQFGFLDLNAAVVASRKGQTANTPAIGTLLLLNEQIQWMLTGGGLPAMAAKARRGAEAIWSWANRRDYARLFVENPEWRSPVVTTVDLDESIPVKDLSAALRRHGIVDVEGYRGLGRNQLRIASFPSVATADIEATLASVDYLVETIPVR